MIELVKNTENEKGDASSKNINSRSCLDEVRSFMLSNKSNLSADMIKRREAMRDRQLRMEELLDEQRVDTDFVNNAKKAIRIIDAALEAHDAMHNDQL